MNEDFFSLFFYSVQNYGSLFKKRPTSVMSNSKLSSMAFGRTVTVCWCMRSVQCR